MYRMSSEPLDAVFQALASGVRRDMLRRLARGSASVTELAEPFELSQPAITKHLQVLEAAGLVRRTRRGRVRPAHLVPDATLPAVDFLAEVRRVWEARYAALDEVLAELQTPPVVGDTEA